MVVIKIHELSLQVFLNSHQSLVQTVVTQGPAFMSRPTFNLFHSAFASSGIWTIGTSPYGDQLVRTRKAMATQLVPRLLSDYTYIIQPRMKRFIGDILELSKGPAIDPTDLLHTYGSGIISEQLVGSTLPDSLVTHIADTETAIFRQRAIGVPVQDYIPLLRLWNEKLYKVSSKFGLSWGSSELERLAKEYRRAQEIYVNDLLTGLRERIENGDESPSVFGNLMRTVSLSHEDLLLIFNTGTTSGINLGFTLTWLIGYLASHPELQERGFEAIREVYGGAVPNPHEFDRVEYIRALHTEGSRYYVPVRLGFAREAASDSTYNGVTIPAGTLVIMNCYACNRDPTVYNSPNEFIPERWMNGRTGRTDDVLKADKVGGHPHLTYGTGRRVCIGFDMANRGIYSTLILLLHFFKWERAMLTDEQRKRIMPRIRGKRECSADMDPLTDAAETALQAIPYAFGMKFTPRDPEALADWLAQEN
ncbi:cytochrome P450 [Gautieria morchelliformis]|nr:cytochrome P450 [Gautieria morchelliformis]